MYVFRRFEENSNDLHLPNVGARASQPALQNCTNLFFAYYLVNYCMILGLQVL